jgi:hypothetical protein
MSGFLESLNDTLNSSTKSTPQNHKLTLSQRQRVLQEEHIQHGLVLNHPQFQEDPLTTIQTHLTNSLQLHRI